MRYWSSALLIPACTLFSIGRKECVRWTGSPREIAYSLLQIDAIYLFEGPSLGWPGKRQNKIAIVVTLEMGVVTLYHTHSSWKSNRFRADFWVDCARPWWKYLHTYVAIADRSTLRWGLTGVWWELVEFTGWWERLEGKMWTYYHRINHLLYGWHAH